MNKLKQLWSNLRSNFWFMPTLIVLVSIALAVALIQVDSTGGSDRLLNQWPRLFGSSAEGARGMISTIAGSMMTVVGVSFSMILVVLALASSQYTSRILRNFMRSRSTQAVLGVFAGIFTYCLIVLRTIRSGDEGTFVPTLAVFFGFLMALVGVGTLMFFIHHIASSIQASNIIALIAKETNATINLLFPEKLGQSPDEEDDEQTPRLLAKRNWCVIQSKESGYIQNVNNDGILRVARDWKTIVRMERGIGEFVVQNTPLVSLAMEDQPDQEKISALHAAFSISRFRSVEQDPAFGIRQIVDVGLKALSPGINDTTTAVTCVDYLTSILAPMATRQIPSSHRYEKGELRVIAKGVSFESLLSESFNQIRSNANGNVAIILHMLDSFQTLAGLTTRTQRRRALLEQVQLIAELAERTVKSIYDQDRINTRLAQLNEMLETEHA
jgi:uncharacterized membrane protein